jgi:hypothetical protein
MVIARDNPAQADGLRRFTPIVVDVFSARVEGTVFAVATAVTALTHINVSRPKAASLKGRGFFINLFPVLFELQVTVAIRI